ncbi:MAG: prepilin-type N-terminal cleavage/methylation domain-containing protein [Candidatus Omnitrophota bacterium]
MPENNLKKGISLLEILIAVSILAIVAVTFLQGFIGCIKLSSMLKESLYALSSVQAKIEEIRNHNFLDIYNYYSGIGRTFKISGLNSQDNMGTVLVDNTNPNLLKVIVLVCWRHMDGRIIGEDGNLDGILQLQEDLNNNTKIDSPVSLATYIIKP